MGESMIKSIERALSINSMCVESSSLQLISAMDNFNLLCTNIENCDLIFQLMKLDLTPFSLTDATQIAINLNKLFNKPVSLNFKNTQETLSVDDYSEIDDTPIILVIENIVDRTADILSAESYSISKISIYLPSTGVLDSYNFNQAWLVVGYIMQQSRILIEQNFGTAVADKSATIRVKYCDNLLQSIRVCLRIYVDEDFIKFIFKDKHKLEFIYKGLSVHLHRYAQVNLTVIYGVISYIRQGDVIHDFII